jgi:uncharacterized membrane protein YphA (DoxX/SURF4 family)
MAMKSNAWLWVVQTVLAALFVFAGGMKLMMPVAALEAMPSPIALSGVFLKFIGAAEVLGAIGLIVPGVVRIRTEMTPIAAAGLVTIMIGATAITAVDAPASAAVPMIVGALAALVAYGRWKRLPAGAASAAAAA